MIAVYVIKWGTILCFKSNIDNKIRSIEKKYIIKVSWVLILLNRFSKKTIIPIVKAAISDSSKFVSSFDLQKKHLPFKSKNPIIGMFCHQNNFFLHFVQNDPLYIIDSPLPCLSITSLKKLPRHGDIKTKEISFINELMLFMCQFFCWSWDRRSVLCQD